MREPIQLSVSQKVHSVIPKGLRPPAQGCEPRATLGPFAKKKTTLKGLRRTAIGAKTQPRWGWKGFDRHPRVGAVRQPWALGRNPVGILFGDYSDETLLLVE